jgi:uncharacterized phiE125 gp8 family phage protein
VPAIYVPGSTPNSSPPVSLAEVKAGLTMSSSITTNDVELQTFINAATSAIEKLIGPMSVQTVTEEIDVHGPQIVLTYMPAVAVTSVSIEPWLGATPVDDTAAWRLNPMTGVLRRRVVGGSLPWYGPGSIFTITYTVGRAQVSDDIKRAVIMQVAEMWKTQRGASPLPSAGESLPPAYAGDAGFLGSDVMELLLPYLLPPGMA